ncbi:hypothetical protein TNCV_193501 [Trichonephila clavipes]|nr:hypothetical protein TNCV_193501 [Trichonephila clavipes]
MVRGFPPLFSFQEPHGGLAAEWLFRVSPCREGTIHLQTFMPFPVFEPMPHGTAVSVTNHYTGWATFKRNDRRYELRVLIISGSIGPKLNSVTAHCVPRPTLPIPVFVTLGIDDALADVPIRGLVWHQTLKVNLHGKFGTQLSTPRMVERLSRPCSARTILDRVLGARAAGVHYRLFSVWTLVPVRLDQQLSDHSTVDEIASGAADCRLTYTMANCPQRRKEERKREREKEGKRARKRQGLVVLGSGEENPRVLLGDADQESETRMSKNALVTGRRQAVEICQSEDYNEESVKSLLEGILAEKREARELKENRETREFEERKLIRAFELERMKLANSTDTISVASTDLEGQGVNRRVNLRDLVPKFDAKNADILKFLKGRRKKKWLRIDGSPNSFLCFR